MDKGPFVGSITQTYTLFYQAWGKSVRLSN
jgi:hypothetical protein